VPRTLPELTPENRHVWTSGATGRLLISRCAGCGYWIQPPGPVCPRCRARDITRREVSGRGTVATFTVNHQPWDPGLTVPYVVAIVELVEQAGLRLTTNIVNCPPEQVRIGMPVRVTFVRDEDVYLPMFAPDDGESTGTAVDGTGR